jgi:hypothetical protein
MRASNGVVMGRSRIALACAAVLGAIAAILPVPANASRQIYEYRILHPSFGNVGTYTNTIDKLGDKTEVTTELHVVVKLLGIVVFQQEAERTELWQGDRMIAFHSVTNTNGDALIVSGVAQGNDFVITTPAGVTTAPANVHPSNPWSLKVFESDTMMSTKTGEFFPVSVSDSGQDDVTIDGADLKLHRYDIIGRKHDVVWLDDNGVTVAFEIEQGNTLVDFHLARSLNQPEYVSVDLSH